MRLMKYIKHQPSKLMTNTVLVAMAALTTACVNVPTATPPAQVGCRTWEIQQLDNSAGRFGVSVLSSDLAKIIGLQDMFVNRTPTGLASVNTSVYNCTEQDVVLSVRSRFSNERGESEIPSAWRTVFLPPRGTASYSEYAISNATVRVSVDIADGNRGQSQFAPGQTYQTPRENLKGGVQ